MSNIFDDVYITWGGEEYCITPTYGMLRRLEGSVSIASIANRTAMGEPPVSHIAFVVAFLLQQKGVKVTGDDVYEAMCHGDVDTTSLSHTVLSAFYPKSKKKGNQPSQKKPKKSTGKNTTK
jgi:hypothetical protein